MPSLSPITAARRAERHHFSFDLAFAALLATQAQQRHINRLQVAEVAQQFAHRQRGHMAALAAHGHSDAAWRRLAQGN